MAETLVEKGTCRACGKKARGGSVFCHNCGETLVAEPAPPPIIKPDSGIFNGNDPRHAKTVEFGSREPAPIGIPEDRLPETAPKATASEAARNEVREGVPEEVRETVVERKRTRVRSKKAAEIEWVEPTSISAVYLIAVVLLAVAAGALVLAAFYLK